MYYRTLIFVFALILATLAVGCGGQQQGNQQKQGSAKSSQASQKSEEQTTTSETTMMQNQGGAEKTTAGGTTGKKGKIGKKPAVKPKAGSAKPVKGVIGAISVKKTRFYFRPTGKKIIPIQYRPKQVRITIGSKKVKPQALEKGHHARVVYVIHRIKKKGAKRDQIYLARTVRLASAAGKKQTGKQNG